MTSQVFHKLEAKGLLQRDVDLTDSRARRLRLTPVGLELVGRAIAAVEQVDAEFFGPEAAGVTPMLQRLIGLTGDRSDRPARLG